MRTNCAPIENLSLCVTVTYNFRTEKKREVATVFFSEGFFVWITQKWTSSGLEVLSINLPDVETWVEIASDRSRKKFSCVRENFSDVIVRRQRWYNVAVDSITIVTALRW